jgi:hypothetical protein
MIALPPSPASRPPLMDHTLDFFAIAAANKLVQGVSAAIEPTQMVASLQAGRPHGQPEPRTERGR